MSHRDFFTRQNRVFLSAHRIADTGRQAGSALFDHGLDHHGEMIGGVELTG